MESQAAFDQMIATVRQEPVVAIDTEAASFHHYHDRVYLIQLSDRRQTWVIDPLAVPDLGTFGALMADPAVEVVFHDADYDLRLFYKEFAFEARGLFDTRITAQLLGLPSIGLAALLEESFGLKPDKRFQRADWSTRPLTGPMLDYAAGDTSHLVELRDILRNRLVEMGRLAWAEEEFKLVEGTRWEPAETDPRVTFMKLKGARALRGRALARLRELYEWRETTASEIDRASFRVMGNDVLLMLAEQPVTDLDALGKLRGVGREALGRWGEAILEALRRGDAIPEDEHPRFERGPRRVIDPAFDARMDKLKTARNAEAERLGLQPGVLCPNGTLEQVAGLQPKTLEELAEAHSLREWQRLEIGPALLAALA
ncbi:MAG TPA: ribonuclease D [Gemmatimonadales bacterium]|nr:ribonuclease D [Gemmatimonadales bacterium]